MKGVKELQKGNYILHRGEPYRVLRKENITAGTHMHTKVKVTVQGLFSGRTEVLTLPPHTGVDDLEIIHKNGQIISKEPLQLMDLVSYETFNATAPEGILEKLNEGEEVTFVEFNGIVRVMEKR